MDNKDVEFLYKYFINHSVRAQGQRGGGVGCYLGSVFRTVLPLFRETESPSSGLKRKHEETPVKKNKKPRVQNKSKQSRKCTIEEKNCKDIFNDGDIQSKNRK